MDGVHYTSEQYRGWSLQEMKQKRGATDHDGHAARDRSGAGIERSPPRRFTAINVHSDRPRTAGQAQPSSEIQSDTWNRPRRVVRNYVVAEYLGLEGNTATVETSNTRNNGATHRRPPQCDGKETLLPIKRAKPRAKNLKATAEAELKLKRRVSDGLRTSKPRKQVRVLHSSDGAAPVAKATDDIVQTPAPKPPLLNNVVLSQTTLSKLDAYRFRVPAVSDEPLSTLQNEVSQQQDKIPVIAPMTSLDAMRAKSGFGFIVYQGQNQGRSSLNETPHLPQDSTLLSTDCQQKLNFREQRKISDMLRWRQRFKQSSNHSSQGKPQAPTLVKRNEHTEAAKDEPQNLHTNDLVLDRSPEAERSWPDSPLPELLTGRESDSGTTDLDEFDGSGYDLTDADLLQLIDVEPSSSTTTLEEDTCCPAASILDYALPADSDPTMGLDPARDIAEEVYGDDWMFVDDDFLELGEFKDSPQRDTANKSENPSTNDPLLPQGQCPISREIIDPKADLSSDTVRSGYHSQIQRHQTFLKPIVRPKFPTQIRDRSPIIGVSADMVLRTCFRIGEAMNAGCSAVRNNRTAILELYARVRSSHREPGSVKQHIQFGDLFHDRPPYIDGAYNVWKGFELWDYDSSRFLSPKGGKRICRCIGKMKREGNKWSLIVLNIWEASWEDVEHVRSIVC